jgi:ElaB/YqjD/DUF883 family membrane-anchored ribosome-binding protein
MDTSSHKARVREAASDLLDEGKKCVHEMRDEGLNKMHEAEENIKEYSDQLLKKVQDNPLTSVLIAGGIGFLLSKILGK